jgi:hypothetical protein
MRRNGCSTGRRGGANSASNRPQMAYEIEMRTVAAQPTLYVRNMTTIPNIAQSIGRYDDLPKAGAALAAWATDNGKRPAGPNWETYQ